MISGVAPAVAPKATLFYYVSKLWFGKKADETQLSLSTAEN